MLVLRRRRVRAQVALCIALPSCLLGTYLKFYTDTPKMRVIFVVVLGCSSMAWV